MILLQVFLLVLALLHQRCQRVLVLGDERQEEESILQDQLHLISTREGTVVVVLFKVENHSSGYYRGLCSFDTERIETGVLFKTCPIP